MTSEFMDIFYDDVKRRVQQMAESCTDKEEFVHDILNINSKTYKELEHSLQGEYATITIKDSLYHAVREALNGFLTIYDGRYGLSEEELSKHGKEVVTWCDSQSLFELPNWRAYCELIDDEEGFKLYGSSAYVVDTQWLKEYTDYEISFRH